MADASKFRHYHSQTNGLVALEWLIAPLNERFALLHDVNQWHNVAQEYRSIAGVLVMANVPEFAKLAQLIQKLAQHPNLQSTEQCQLVCASRLLAHELNYYVRTGLVSTTSLKLKTAYLAYLLDEEDLPSQMDFGEQMFVIDDVSNSQSWQMFFETLPPIDSDIITIEQLGHLKQTLPTWQNHPLLYRLSKLVGLWLTDLSGRSLDFMTLCLLAKLYQASLLSFLPIIDESRQIWLYDLCFDVCVALKELSNPSLAVQKLLERLEDKHLIEQDFLVYVVLTLTKMSPATSQDVQTLQALKQQLCVRGWTQYADDFDQAIQTALTKRADLSGLCTKIQALLAVLQTHLDTQLTYHAKQQVSDYLRSKNVADLPASDEFVRLGHKLAGTPLDGVCVVYQQFAEVFAVLCNKAPKRISWQLAHQLADALLLFELFLAELTKQRFDHVALEQVVSHLAQAMDLALGLGDEVDEIFDIYRQLLQAHQNTVLYDDGGRHEPVVAELVDVSPQTPNSPNDEFIEEAVVSDIIIASKPTVSKPQPIFKPVFKPVPSASPQPLVADEYQSKDIFLTDILSIPSISLSHQNNHNDIKAMAVSKMMFQESAEDLSDIENLLRPSNQHKKPTAKTAKVAESLSVYKAFIEETSPVNDHNSTAPALGNTEHASEAYLSIKAQLKADDFSFDEEFREIFIEEVDEVLAELWQSLPKWQQQLTNTEELTNIRRHFHTLKGSGRMVGAFTVGETAWAIENLLNRVLEGVLVASESMATLVAAVAEAVPVLVADFAQKAVPSVDCAVFILQANNLLAGKAVDEGLGDISTTAPDTTSVTTSVATPEITPDTTLDTVPAPVEIIQADTEVSQTTSPDEVLSEMLLPEVLSPFMELASQPVASMFPDADKDIRAIFVEEAQEILTQIIPAFTKWRLDLSQRTLLMDIRDGFDALKGSGRMVGATQLGELAWAMENLLNHMLDGSIAISEAMVVLLSDVLADFARLVSLFGVGTEHYPQQVVLWIACANAYAQGHGDDFDYRVFSRFAKEHGMDWSLGDELAADEINHQLTDQVGDTPDTAQEHNHNHNDEPNQNNQSPALGFIQEAKAVILNATPKTADDEEEHMLCQIFVEEGRELLADVKEFLQNNKDKANVPVNDRVVRAFHTLRGASGLPPLAPVGEVGAIIEQGLQTLQQHDAPMERTHLQALAHAVELVEAHLSAYEDSDDEANINFSEDKHTLESLLDTQENFDIGALIVGVDGLLDAEFELIGFSQKSPADIVAYANQQSQELALLLARTSEYPKFQAVLTALAEAYQKLSQYAEHIDEAFVSDLVAVHRELIGLFDSLAGSMSLRVDEALLDKLSAWQPVDTQTATHEVQADKVQAGEVEADEAQINIDIDEAMSEAQSGVDEVQTSVVEDDKVAIETQTDNAPVEANQAKTAIVHIDKSNAQTDDVQTDDVQTDDVQTDDVQIDDVQIDDVQIDDVQIDKIAVNTSQFDECQIEALVDEIKAGEPQAKTKTDQTKVQIDEVITAKAIADEIDVGDDTKVQADKTKEQAKAPIDELQADDIKNPTGKTNTQKDTSKTEQACVDDVEILPDDIATDEALIDTAQTKSTQTEAITTSMPAKKKVLSSEALVVDNLAIDDELLEIFLTEAQDIIDRSTSNFQAWRADSTDSDKQTILQRDLYSLAGGSSLAGVMSVYRLASTAELVFEGFKTGQLTINDDWFGVLQQVYDVLTLQIDTIKTRQQSFFVENAVSDLQHYVSAGIPKGASLRTPVIEVEDELELAIAYEPEELPTTELSAKALVANVPSIDVQQFIKDSWQGVLPDKDILNIFLEEAKELAESSSEDFARFRSNTGDTQILQALQRKIHTIKGGARMVSANGVSDLAHEMETIYEDLGNHRYAVNQSLVKLLFACHDWIVSAITLLQSYYNPPRPTLLIDALHQFLQNPDSVVAVPVVSLANEAKMLAQEHLPIQPTVQSDISQLPPAHGVFNQKVAEHNNAEMVRIALPVMEDMINLSGETAISRARIDMSIASLTLSIEEMGVTVQRLADQLRRMDIELEAQILSQIDETDKLDAGFDPLEMDRYSSLNQLSKSLSESASDLLDIKTTLLDKTRGSESLLLQLSRVQTELQDKLMRSRMVPFSRLTPRLHRIVRQTANELGKMAELTVINADGEVDRTILEHITAPLEHMLRNAIDHGIEFAEQRSELGKSTIGQIKLQLQREGNELVVLLSDDGAGIDVEGVRQKIIAQGLIRPEDKLSDSDIMQYIFNAGLSTAGKVTQISGRGVGMDVVRTEIRQLGGSVSVESTKGQGSCFIMRVPLVVALSDVLVVRMADHQYAIPLVQIERVVQVSANRLLEHYRLDMPSIDLDGQAYRLRYLNEILSNREFSKDGPDDSVPVIIAKSQVGSFALQVDEIVGSRLEVVAKPLGNQLSRLSGISAATIMGDGSVMLILDLPALMRTPQQIHIKEDKPAQARHLIMVIDDSVTVRKVTSRFLERQGFDVVVAKDGVHAMEILQDTTPDLLLLDIEMPRMDGFEVATQVRHSQRLKEVPIIMVTSRTGEKHRKRAFEIGVDAYLGKPFQEVQLLANIHTLLNIETAIS